MEKGYGFIARLRFVLIVFFSLLVTICLVPLQLIAILASKPLSRKIPLLWHRCILAIIGTRVLVHGDPPKHRPLLIVANHVSWSDILVMGSLMELCFISKDDVKDWPGINWLARLQRTVFVNRKKRGDAKVQADSVAARLADGDAMVLFAEGTTADGHYVYPFKSALFGAAQIALDDSNFEEIIVQPVAIAYTKLFGMPLGRYHQTMASWPGDIPLGSHLIGFLKNGAYDVEVIIGEPLKFTKQTKRREIAKTCEDQVREMFAKAMQGHYLKQI